MADAVDQGEQRTNLEIPPPLFVLPCIVFDCLRKPEHTNTTSRFLSANTGFDSWNKQGLLPRSVDDRPSFAYLRRQVVPRVACA